jgi:ankyrin repeat protein
MNMRNWENYKETINLSEDVFSLARGGDVQSCTEFLDSNRDQDINQKNHKGYSALMISVYNGNYEASELLLERGADPNSSDLSGNTILMGAAFKGDAELIKLLINRGARKELKNLDGLTAEQWASAFGRHNVLSILKPDANYSKFQNMMNAIKVIWSFVKPKFKKEVTA